MENLISQFTNVQILVIGAGGAGIRAAITAADKGKNVLLLSETEIGNSGSTFYPLSYEWGMLFAENEKDAEIFYQEIVSASGECMNKKLARKLAYDSREAYLQMCEEGIHFVPMKEMGIVGCFGRKSRGAFGCDREEIIQAQKTSLLKRNNIKFRSDLSVVSLLIKNQVCYGAVAVDQEGSLQAIYAEVVVLACGGGEDLYEFGTAYGNLNGGAYAMAARHGARLVNLEFIQFVHGSVKPVRGINYYPFSYEELPRVYNARMESCLQEYLPPDVTEEECLLAHAKHGPFSTDSKGKYLEYAMIGEYQKGNGAGLLIVPDKERVHKPRYRLWNQFLDEYGLDASVSMQLFPFAQGFNGGVLLHDDLSTDIKGLFACGESAGGCHGPNRMGGLCILATQVFGKAAGDAAASWDSSPAGKPDLGECEAMLRDEFGQKKTDKHQDPEKAMQRIRHIMQTYACLQRSEDGLSEALKKIEEIQINPLEHLGEKDTALYFRTQNAADAARLILFSMKQRRESRGCHDRADYPERDEKQTAMNWVTLEGRMLQGGCLNT